MILKGILGQAKIKCEHLALKHNDAYIKVRHKEAEIKELTASLAAKEKDLEYLQQTEIIYRGKLSEARKAYDESCLNLEKIVKK